MRPLARAAACAAVLSSAACASGKAPLYHWNGYEQALVAHTKNPQDHAAYVASLWTVIETSRQQGTRAPPGVQAEYGYALYEEGRTADAIPWFDAEARDWPESRIFMQKMTPQPAGDPSQQKMMMWMPLIFGVMFWNLPSGLVLYYLTSNLVGMGQQWFFNHTELATQAAQSV